MDLARYQSEGWLRFVQAALIGLLWPAASLAQTLDPQVLEDLQKQLGVERMIDSQQSQPQDSGGLPATPQLSIPSGQVDTPEEQEVRRAQARRELRTLYEPSEVERDYRRRLDEPRLRQFGYDFFRAAPAPTGVRTGAIGDDYVLGIGDELQISFRGSTNRTQRVKVDRDGRIVVGDFLPIQVAGRSLSSVRSELEAQTKRSMLATNVFVSVGEVRAISVFVGGEVERPGQYSLTSLSDVGTALAQAGGVRRTGSLRQVRLVRAGGGSVVVDLYGLLGIGSPSDVRLRDGDRLIVPVIGPTVAVTGAVTRPGIYELRGNASVSAVVAFAGGAIRQRGGQVVISRIGSCLLYTSDAADDM
jgi:polysaccharide export outer membrane protein